MKNISDYPMTLRPEHLAEILDLNPKSVYAMLAAKKIPCARKVGGAWRIRKDLFWQWLAGDERKAG